MNLLVHIARLEWFRAKSKHPDTKVITTVTPNYDENIGVTIMDNGTICDFGYTWSSK